MEKIEYNNLVINNELTKLANISNSNDLVDCKYLDLYLIEYLLRENIHTTIMDSRTQHSSKWINFYLKYNILKPLLKCYLMPLLEIVNGRLILDVLLEKINDQDKLELLANLKNNSYWELHDHEKEVIDLYKKHGIILKQIFINQPSILNSHVTKKKKSSDLIKEFCDAYKDTDSYVLSIYVHEFKRRLSIDSQRASLDLEKLIVHKRKHKNFVLKVSTDTEGEYNSALSTITISPKRSGILTHELSHLMYQEFDREDDVLEKYEIIRKKIDRSKTISKIINYLKIFHERFKIMNNYFEEIYYHEIKKKYGSYNEYVKIVCNDVYKSNPDIISVNDDRLYFYLDDDNIVDVVTELLMIEKEEYASAYTRNYYNEELMLENLLDALLKGAICDGKLDIFCLSGHLGRDFEECESLSFDECLADYDTIKNSKKSERLLNDLHDLVGDDLINLLDEYLSKNRGLKNGI